MSKTVKFLFLLMCGTLTALFTALLTGCEACGNSSIDNNAAGQVKQVHRNTPMLCPNYVNATVSLGIMQNGVGSMSTHDASFTLDNADHIKLFEEAAKSGKLVDINYRERRATFCIDEYIVTDVKYLEATPAAAPVKDPSMPFQAQRPLSPTREIKVTTAAGDTIVGTVLGGEIVGVTINGTTVALDGFLGQAAIKELKK